MRRTALVVLAMLFMSEAFAAETGPDPDQRSLPHGIISHGDSGDVMEDFFGPQVQRDSRAEPESARDKRDPAVRWNAPGSGR